MYIYIYIQYIAISPQLNRIQLKTGSFSNFQWKKINKFQDVFYIFVDGAVHTKPVKSKRISCSLIFLVFAFKNNINNLASTSRLISYFLLHFLHTFTFSLTSLCSIATGDRELFDVGNSARSKSDTKAQCVCAWGGGCMSVWSKVSVGKKGEGNSPPPVADLPSISLQESPTYTKRMRSFLMRSSLPHLSISLCVCSLVILHI